MRDNQRQRVYNWENEQFVRSPDDLPTITDIDQFARAALLWRGSWTTVQHEADYRARVRAKAKRWVWIRDGRGCRWAWGSSSYWRITLPRWSRSFPVVCHELAHVFAPSGPNYAAHGPEFVAEYIGLVTEFVGLDYDSLVRSARDRNVAVAENYWRGFDGSPNVPARGVPWEKRPFKLY